MRQHVLIVEHHRKTRIAMCELFGRAGMTTHSAVSVNAAIDKLSCIPSMIVVDLDLPDGSGVEVLEAVRAVGLETKIAVIAGVTDAPPDGWIPRYHPDVIFGKPIDMADFVDWLSGFDANYKMPLFTEQDAEFALAA